MRGRLERERDGVQLRSSPPRRRPRLLCEARKWKGGVRREGFEASKSEISGDLSLVWTGRSCDRRFDFYKAPLPTSGALPTLIQLKLKGSRFEREDYGGTARILSESCDSEGAATAPSFPPSPSPKIPLPVFRSKPPSQPSLFSDSKPKRRIVHSNAAFNSSSLLIILIFLLSL